MREAQVLRLDDGSLVVIAPSGVRHRVLGLQTQSAPVSTASRVASALREMALAVQDAAVATAPLQRCGLEWLQ